MRDSDSGKVVRCVVLDAMGVIFRAADDVAELLVPFVSRAGGTTNATEVDATYLSASLGSICPDDFWRTVGLAPDVENQYLAQHELMPGVMPFLQAMQSQRMPVWCVSNDVGRWSSALRTRFDLDSLLAGAVISSEVRSRKPDPMIYGCLLEKCGYERREILFVDDRDKNVAAAIDIGIPAVRFDPATGYAAITRLIGRSS